MARKSSSSSATSHGKKKKKSAWLPVMGLSLAILVGLVSFFLAPALLDFGASQSDSLKRQIEDFEANPGGLPEKSFDYVTALILWLVFMGLFMFIAAVAVGTDPSTAAVRTMQPPRGAKSESIKDMKKQLRAAKKRERQRPRK
ncbi:MAG: hypothetical protein JXQ72_17615 [Anaerolineae bacterium]|nr:hypothetical protein [Anaerolineae bacterium]